MTRLNVLVLAALLAIQALPVAAQMDSREGIALQNQILGLRRDLESLQAQQGGGGGSGPRYRNDPQPNRAPNDMVASLLDRVTQLEDQVRALQGRVDETANRVQRMNDDLAKQIADLKFTLQSAPAAPPPSGSNLGGVAPAPPGDVTAPRTPELSMQQGNAALARRDYATAEASAREVLASRSPRTYDAQFLLSQALLGKRDFQQSALAYDDLYNRARTGPHAQDALLGLAASLSAINEKRPACDTLIKLGTEFPRMRPDIREAAAGLRGRNGCG